MNIVEVFFEYNKSSSFFRNNDLKLKNANNAKLEQERLDNAKKLAEDLGVSLDDYDFEQIGDRISQERGLDIVGWLPFDDNCSNMII